ncbi:glycerol-3-phosphate acyltransferase [Sphaerisporangium sp. TRM90804]|uniref:glycerol-3-phosphate acyltransferase n=1 Tax=Sphaerisporangium sp. TRM90804 TaxID=3031113 RepID=UPI00244C5A26|nr:glycerol-3-phosphate acyltransferase [Sphaerisporangium sp. TRM90804]MDH2429646.1 glycerol-3-phosphate acyltransferase [Sphaerisporangium sp. TRM90804]
MVPVLVAVIGGYLLGSVPVAVLVARTHGFDPRDVGDRNPGFWNMRRRLGGRPAVPVFAGDLLKGTLAGLLGLLVSGAHTAGLAVTAPGGVAAGGVLPEHMMVGAGLLPLYGTVAGDSVVPVYAAVAAAMAGHAWPVFAGFRGGRSILAFAGGVAVICPPGFLLAVGLLVVTALAARSFAVGARVGVFAVPVLQLLFVPVLQVAATGLLMCLIGLRFGQAALAGRRPGRAGP